MSQEGANTRVRSLEELLQHQAVVTIALGHAERSCWNGEIGVLPRPGISAGVLGLADWEGRLHYSEPHVLAPLREMFAHPGEARSDKTLARFKEAVLTIFHENNHLLASCDREHAEAARAWDWPAIVLEEGVTEAYSHQRLDTFIDAMGLEDLAPGLRATRIEMAYPQYVPAVIALASRVAELADSSLEAVLERLNAETAAGKYPRLADLALGGRGTGVRSAERRRRSRALERHLGRVLGRARLIPLAAPRTHMELSQALGSEAVRVLDEHLARIGHTPALPARATRCMRTAAWLQAAAARHSHDARSVRTTDSRQTGEVTR